MDERGTTKKNKKTKKQNRLAVMVNLCIKVHWKDMKSGKEKTT